MALKASAGIFRKVVTMSPMPAETTPPPTPVPRKNASASFGVIATDTQ
jgi:hypothetical protein